jgi:hypothetical protein
MGVRVTMQIAALDINANQVRGARGMVGQRPQSLHFGGRQATLPLAISLEEPVLQVGRAGLACSRRAPDRACTGFLSQLGREKRWQYGRHRLDSRSAIATVCNQIRGPLAGVQGIVVSAPGYLTAEQIRLLDETLRHVGLPVQGLVNRDLAVMANNCANEPVHHIGLVVDVDDHAMTWAVCRPSDRELSCLGQHVASLLGLGVWNERVIGCVAESCIRTCRRDPRVLPEADKSVFDQLECVLDAVARNQTATIRAQTTDWLQVLTIDPADVLAACAGLARQAASVTHAALTWAETQLTSATIYLTAEAARLPGLAAAIYRQIENQTPVTNLPAAAPLEAAFDLAQRICRGEVAGGLFGASMPLAATIDDWADSLPFPEMDLAN